ncbi:AAEL014239-PA [Aedes aegypti]|uniref:AAEL014239-PA n=2 Tax=Aedes aegypti TaxID=7159 RepID=A0A1S4G1D7_AEDAE|nr:uncharacterized protein LOC5563942 [Aedes aegypti]EAT33482.1 AAEL014239-PA [Aedes aegypti]
MKLWLTVVCVLGFLSGGVFTMYTSISIGSQGLNSISASLKSIGTVMNAFYKNLNNARNKVIPKLDSLAEYVNATYKSLNDSYGATQPSMVNVMYNLEWFSRQFYYGEQQVNSAIGNDLSHLNYELQQTMDQMMQNYNNLLNSYAYQQNSEACAVQYASVVTSVPDQLAKFGTCLQTEVDTVPTVVAPLQEILNLVKSDFVSLTKQLKICATTSTNCINEYFNNIYMEINNINMELYMASSLLQFYQYDAMYRNQLCGELVKYNVQDITMNLMQQFSQCMYPPMP